MQGTPPARQLACTARLVRRLAQGCNRYALSIMPQPIADGGTGIRAWDTSMVCNLKVALRRSGCQLDQRVATVAHDGDKIRAPWVGRGS